MNRELNLTGDPRQDERASHPELEASVGELRSASAAIDDAITKLVNDEIRNTEGMVTQEAPNANQRSLLHAITESIIGILTDKSIVRSFESIAAKVGNDISRELVEVISTSVTYAVFESVDHYHQQLMDTLSPEFETISTVVTELDSRITVVEGRQDPN